MDDYEYEYVDDDEATLEVEDIGERLKRSGSLISSQEVTIKILPSIE